MCAILPFARLSYRANESWLLPRQITIEKVRHHSFSSSMATPALHRDQHLRQAEEAVQLSTSRVSFSLHYRINLFVHFISISPPTNHPFVQFTVSRSLQPPPFPTLDITLVSNSPSLTYFNVQVAFLTQKPSVERQSGKSRR